MLVWVGAGYVWWPESIPLTPALSPMGGEGEPIFVVGQISACLKA